MLIFTYKLNKEDIGFIVKLPSNPFLFPILIEKRYKLIITVDKDGLAKGELTYLYEEDK